MRSLPPTVDFEDKDFPELAEVFRTIEAGIAAIVASDPALHPDPGPNRQAPSPRPSRQGRPAQRQAA